MSCDLKIELSAIGTIKRVVAGTVYIEEENESLTFLLKKPVPQGLMGAGSLPSYGIE